MATKIIGKDRQTGSALEKYTDAVFVRDDKKFYFGNDGDFSFEYDEDGNNVLLTAGADIRISDTQMLQFGDDGDTTIAFDGTRTVVAGTTLAFSDTTQLAFGTGADTTIAFDGTNTLIAGSTVTFSDSTKLGFGTDSDILIYYHAQSDSLMITGLPTADPLLTGLLWVSDQTLKLSV